MRRAFTLIYLITATLYSQSSPPGNLFVPITPCRIADTRIPSATFGLGAPAIASNSTRTIPVRSSPCPVANEAAAYSLNVTVIPHGPLAYLTLWPTGQPQPLVSTLNSFEGKVVANAAIVPAGVGGAVEVFGPRTTQTW